MTQFLQNAFLVMMSLLPLFQRVYAFPDGYGLKKFQVRCYKQCTAYTMLGICILPALTGLHSESQDFIKSVFKWNACVQTSIWRPIWVTRKWNGSRRSQTRSLSESVFWRHKVISFYFTFFKLIWSHYKRMNLS